MVSALGPFAAGRGQDFVSAMEDISDLPQDFFDGALAEYLFGRATSIYGGTNEIQREILAKATLDTLR